MGADGKPKMEAGQPWLFMQGDPRMVSGWNLGFDGMHVGGKRRLFIPYQMAYGEVGSPSPDPKKPGIPPKADLIFDIELVQVMDGARRQTERSRGNRRMYRGKKAADELFTRKRTSILARSKGTTRRFNISGISPAVPKSKLARRILLDGKCYAALNNLQAALDAFQAVAAKYPSSKLASTALFDQEAFTPRRQKTTEDLVREDRGPYPRKLLSFIPAGGGAKSTNQTDNAVRKFQVTITHTEIRSERGRRPPVLSLAADFGYCVIVAWNFLTALSVWFVGFSTTPCWYEASAASSDLGYWSWIFGER